MTIAVIAEKPSVARDIAKVIGARQRGEGRLHGNGYVVTWAVGHLVALAEPHGIRPEWKRWRRETLPMIPERWPLEVYEKTRDQFEIVSRVLNDPEIEEVVCATDAGREGELIFRYVYEACGCRKPVRRLWISSLTESAIRRGFEQLRPGSDFDPLADAARGRSRADWLVGMNLSRAYTLVWKDESEQSALSVGRVQTPTLAMVVERELAIRDFVPEDYKEVVACFQPPAEAEAYEGTWFDPALDAPGVRSKASGASAEAKESAAAKADETGERRQRARRLPPDGERAAQIVERALRGEARVASIVGRQRKLPPPLLYDLTELQRHANRLYGFSASHTLELAQRLYEQKKLISYPRTDSRHLSRDVADELLGVVRAISGRYDPALLAEGTGERPLGKRHVDDARVSDHHALIPTAVDPAKVRLARDEERIYDLICRRLLSAWHADHLYSTTRVITTITTITTIEPNARDATDDTLDADARAPVVDHYASTGTKVDRVGWKVLDVRSSSARAGTDAATAEQVLPPELEEGQAQRVLEARAVDRRTRPPRRFTEGTLLTAMESAGKSLDEKALSDAMRENGLGTPATRAAIIETLLQRRYIEREKKNLVATDRGIRLIGLVHPDVKSPIMTGRWESKLQAMQRGEQDLAPFMAEIEAWLCTAVRRVLAESPTKQRGSSNRDDAPPTGRREGPSSGEAAASRVRRAQAIAELNREPGAAPPRSSAHDERPVASVARAEPAQQALAIAAPGVPPERRPTPPEELRGLLQRAFHFDDFRPHQRAACEEATRGGDVLLVMPTGAGKSLCYQLPGIARAGTTLVVSPLIALMEDQVSKLQAQGFRAERIHSGRDRAHSRAVCADYLRGELDFLFIAPERLSVPGFPEMLAKRKPSLIAVDEAHCISQWGHDFRPDYRMLGERLPLLRPAPIIALTATATPLVQRDIVEQLGTPDATRSIHGFRRTNIAVEVVELAPGERERATVDLLKRAAHRPAIVYAPTRKKAESLAQKLEKQLPCAVYHAGISAAKRDQVQAEFLSGRLDVIVATIAFGMGIDKADVRTVVHLALPGSVEGYYQEIGRAGRDGAPSRAVLLHSYADRRTHEWFLDRDYPDVADLERVHAALAEKPCSTDALRLRVNDRRRMSEDKFEKALEKLWIHGGARVTPEGDASLGAKNWKAAYQRQREHRVAQLAEIARYAERADCHMRKLVQHFGDQEDRGEPCGQCDVCSPGTSVVLRFREPSPTELEAMQQILKSLRDRNGPSTGKLHLDTFGDSLDRRAFEGLLATLARAALLHLEDDSFEGEDGRIEYRRAFITSSGRAAGDDALRGLDMVAPPRRPSKSRTRKSASSGAKRSAGVGTRRRAPRRRAAAEPLDAAAAGAPAELVETLRAWRLEKARVRRVPAFRILTDRTLLGIAAERPRDEESLLAVHGMGATLMRKYGQEILAIMRD
jgi:DNA topoisomerase-3